MSYISEYLWADERFDRSTVSLIYERNTWSYAYRAGYREPRFRPPSIYCMSLISNKVDQRACDINILDFSLSLLMDPDLYH